MDCIEIPREACESIDNKGTNAFKAITAGCKEISHKYFLCDNGETYEYAIYLEQDVESIISKNLENVRIVSGFI